MKVEARAVGFDDALLKPARPMPEAYTRINKYIQDRLGVRLDPVEALKAEKAAAATLAALETQHEALMRARKLNEAITESLKKVTSTLTEMEAKDTVLGYSWYLVKYYASGRCLRPEIERKLEDDIKHSDGSTQSPPLRKKLHHRNLPQSVHFSKRKTKGSTPFGSVESDQSTEDFSHLIQDRDEVLAQHLDHLRIAALAMGKELSHQEETLEKLDDELQLTPLGDAMTIAERLINSSVPKTFHPVPT